MGKADIVIILGNARQMMRIMQGYSNKFGMARHLSTVGNQAMCSDLVAKPFSNNDINLSLLCAGARRNTQCTEGEMGAGFPIQYMSPLTEGVLITLNLVECNEEKKRILEALEEPMELGMAIEMNMSYIQKGMRYRQYCLEMARIAAVALSMRASAASTPPLQSTAAQVWMPASSGQEWPSQSSSCWEAARIAAGPPAVPPP